MPLSDREQQILQDIERQLYDEDPKFAKGVAQKTLDTHTTKNTRLGLALFLAGFLTLFAFFFKTNLFLGVAAFLLMVAGATLAFQNIKKSTVDKVRESGERNPLSAIFGKVESRIKDARRRDES